MKKLMIAAAAAAMVGGAYAGEDLHTYNWTQTNVAMQVTQVVQFKQKVTTSKYIDLNADKKKFGKTIKDSLMEFDLSGIETDQAIDGVYYYNAKDGKWQGFVWNRQIGIASIGGSGEALTFDVFENENNTKAIAAYKWDSENDRASVYGTLKYGKKDAAGVKHVIAELSNLKDTLGRYTYTIKTFKATTKKTAQELVDAYVEKLWKKAQPKVK